MDDASRSRVVQMRIAWIIIAAAYVMVWIAPFLADLTGQAHGAAQNFANLRDPSKFGWHVIALFGAVSFAYALEFDKGNWAGIFAGFAFVLMDTFNEIWNGLIFTATGGYSAYWMCNFPSGFQTLIGWNIEIIFNFFFWGLIITKGIPRDKEMKFFGVLNNRVVLALFWGVLGVIIEIILNSFDALIWNYWWWSARFPFFLILLAYFPFALITFYVYDLPTTKQQARFVGIMATILLIALLVFIPLRWI